MVAETNPRTRKVTVSLPASLLDRLDNQVSLRKRSAFVARAIEGQLAIEEQAAAIEASAGAWRDEDYPHMACEAAMDRWLAELHGPAHREGADPSANVG